MKDKQVCRISMVKGSLCIGLLHTTICCQGPVILLRGYLCFHVKKEYKSGPIEAMKAEKNLCINGSLFSSLYPSPY